MAAALFMMLKSGVLAAVAGYRINRMSRRAGGAVAWAAARLCAEGRELSEEEGRAKPDQTMPSSMRGGTSRRADRARR
jgi:hypothetical protein